VSEVTIRIDGLAQFVRNLRKIDRQLPALVRLAGNEAAELVIGTARPNVPRRSGRAAASLRPQSTRTETRVIAGGRRAPHYPWLDFGGGVGRRKRTRRQFLKEGRYLYPAYFAKRDSGEIQRVLERVLLDAAHHADVAVD